MWMEWLWFRLKIQLEQLRKKQRKVRDCLELQKELKGDLLMARLC